MGVKRAPDAVVQLSVPWSEYRALLDKYDGLVREVMAMRREGFTPQPMETVTQVAQGFPDEVQTAIRELVAAAPADSDLERTLTEGAQQMLRLGVEDRVVAERIREGEPADL